MIQRAYTSYLNTLDTLSQVKVFRQASGLNTDDSHITFFHDLFTAQADQILVVEAEDAANLDLPTLYNQLFEGILNKTVPEGITEDQKKTVHYNLGTIIKKETTDLDGKPHFTLNLPICIQY